MDRRQFIMCTLGTGSIMLIPSWARANRSFFPLEMDAMDAVDMAPMERLSGFQGSKTIEGDIPDEAHEIFWDKPGYLKKKGGIPKATSQYDVVVVGGGIAGLSAAYNLKNKKVLLIEGNPRLGGNSKSQTVGKTSISQGAAYLAAFEPGDELDQLYTELGIKRLIRNTANLDEPVTMNGKVFKNFWEGTTDPAKAADFKRAKEIFQNIFDHKLPELPIWDSTSSMRNYVNGLDQMSFSQWIAREIGNVHPHIMEFITLYCWSSFSASPSELSAAQALYFFASDTCGGANVLPGGNGTVAQAMYQKMQSRGNVTFRSMCFGADIKTLGANKVQICFRNESNNLETVLATKCIIAGQKKVAKFICDEIPADQIKAMDSIPYRAYLQANIFLNKKVPSPGYDVYSLIGKIPTDPKKDSTDRCVADMLFADWATGDNVDKTVLSLYLPLPYDMAQQYLFIDNLYEKYQDRVKIAMAPHLSNMGLSWSDVAGMRLVRTGHSMPVARTGMIANGQWEKASADIKGCIYFANQDNWGSPCFETSYGSGRDAARKC